MNLTKVDTHGYKCFKDKTSMYTWGKVTSILGVNEAGKSSFLNVLVCFNYEKHFSYDGSNYLNI